MLCRNSRVEPAGVLPRMVAGSSLAGYQRGFLTALWRPRGTPLAVATDEQMQLQRLLKGLSNHRVRIPQTLLLVSRGRRAV